MLLSKNKLINFLYFLKTTEDTVINNIYLDILSNYDKKLKILSIDNIKLDELIIKYTKPTLIKKLATLFRTEQIEYPYISSFIDFSIIKKTIDNIQKISIVKKIKNDKQIIYTLYTDDIINNIKLNINDIEFFKNNLNYCIINYFSEKDILKCKKKNFFIAPYDLIYSKNNYLENIFEYLILNNKEISSTLIKTYIKKNIAFCSNNNLLHIVSMFKYEFSEFINTKNINIINIGVEWGEWNIFAYLFPNTKCYSFYCNNLHENTIKKNINFKNILQMQINITYKPDEYTSIKYDFLFINLEFLFNYLSDSNSTDYNIFEKNIIPILNTINTKYIIFKLNYNYDKLDIFNNYFNKDYKQIIIDTSLYLIYDKYKKNMLY